MSRKSESGLKVSCMGREGNMSSCLPPAKPNMYTSRVMQVKCAYGKFLHAIYTQQCTQRNKCCMLF